MAGVPVDDTQMVVDKSEWRMLVDSDKFLSALESVGVDNWEGYETAVQLYHGEITEDDI
ncbi:hypothetical protein SEA_ALONE_131 [Streptomyces phage Alone3]|nr:hypothetical protein SEA_ALONE_131 [Streptomyces phage Alone3]